MPVQDEFHSTRFNAFTLVEILVVISLIGLMTVPILLNFRSGRSNQALLASADVFGTQLKTARLYSRETKDSRAWGIVSVDAQKYSLMSKSTSNETVVESRLLEKQIEFVGDFTIWFEAGSGTTADDKTITLINILGKKIDVTISKTGVIEMSSVY